MLPKPNQEVASSPSHGRQVISLGTCGEQKHLSEFLPSCTQSGLQASAYAAVIQLMELLCDERSAFPHRPTRSKIIRARVALSDTTAVRRGEGRLISGSRARRTAAMIAAAMDFRRTERPPETHCSAKLFESASTNQQEAPKDKGRLPAASPPSRLSSLPMAESLPGQ